MGLSGMDRELLKIQLAQAISKGGFDYLKLQNEGDSFSCQIEGDLFSTLGVLGQVMCTFHQSTGIPIHVLCTYLELCCEIVQEVKKDQNDKQEQEQEQEDMFSQFMNILSSYNEEDK